ncbi:LppU/SCO3897 family protein [Micromonospora sp. CA-259024]|uniref:LppU/SCO3897 family protein n=1 Tax=Micromonospora sp. CA-259024 TaxID=3239965 RepID=UPI003D8BDC79
MTSEGPHRPGQEPDEVSPGAGGPAPYGDRPAQPDNGHNAAGPDLGWAPPPPTRPNPSAPAWATQSEQPPTPAWGAAAAPQPNDPAQPAWGAAPAPQPNDHAQPAWAAGGGASEPPQQQSGTWPGNDGTPAPPQPGPWANQQQGWTPAEQSPPAPAWTANAAEQPDWVQAQPAARGAAQVPPATAAWPAQEDPARTGAWGGTAPANAPAGDWRGAESQQPEPPQAAGWPGGAQQDDASGNGGWPAGPPARDDQPVWTPAEQSPPTWGQPAEPTEQPAPGRAQAAQPNAARGAAQVPAPATNWPGQDEPSRSGGWAAQQQVQPAGWGDGGDVRQDQAAQPAAWGGAESRPQQPDWVLSPQDQPTERPEPAGWTPAEQSGLPARASASVPGNDGAPGWAASPDNAAQGNSGVPEVQPWAPGEVWGRAEAEASAQARGGWEADRGDEAPAYQPGPAPGISPANAVPLPPQEQRVPGASLAAAPPSDYAPQSQFAPIPEQPAYAERDTPDAAAQYEAEPAGWGRAEDAAASGAVVPAPRTSPESGAGRAVVPVPEVESAASAAARATASASVPLASRVMPPTDQAIRPAGAATPQPRVYGRPARPEPENEPEPEAFQVDPGAERQGAPEWPNDPQRQGAPDWQSDPQRQVGPGWGGESAAEPRFDDRQPAPNSFNEAPSAPPAFPPGVPSFVDAPGNNRPVNGTRPHAGAERPADQFGGPGSPAAGTAAVNETTAFGGPSFGGPGFGAGPATEAAPSAGFPPAFPPPQQPVPSWGQEAGQSDQGRFDAFKPDAEEPKAEPPTPKVRNGRVLAAVLIAAVLILAVPLGLLMLLGKFGGNDAPTFDPAVGTCVKQSGQGGASAADCGEAGAFTIVSKVDAKEKCTDTTQPHVVLPGDGTNRVLCLKPATK